MFNCLHDFLDYHARINADVVLAHDEIDRITYGEALERANKIESPPVTINRLVALSLPNSA
jgi:hypothetical protein